MFGRRMPNSKGYRRILSTSKMTYCHQSRVVHSARTENRDLDSLGAGVDSPLSGNVQRNCSCLQFRRRRTRKAPSLGRLRSGQTRQISGGGTQETTLEVRLAFRKDCGGFVIASIIAKMCEIPFHT